MSPGDRSASAGSEGPDERTDEGTSAQADNADAQDQADAERRRERAVTDLTRGYERGSRASAERLQRERDSNDASIRAERKTADRVRARERGRALREIAIEREGRLGAEREYEALCSDHADQARVFDALVARARDELSSCRTRTDQLLSTQELSPSGKEAVAVIRGSVDRLEDLIERLTLDDPATAEDGAS